MYSDVFCKVYNEFGWNYYPEIFGEQLLEWLRRQDIRPRTSMDLACGTGILCEILHKSGIRASGMDFSAGMIEIARKGDPEIHYDVADMITYCPEEQFDLVTCTGDALNHIAGLADVERIFRNVYAYTSSGGYFIFDILNENEVSTSEPFEMDFSDTIRVWFQMTRPGDQQANLMIRVYENGDLQFEENIRETIHDPEFICDLLRKSGFEVLKCADRLLDDGGHGTTWFVLAKKKQHGYILTQIKEGLIMHSSADVEVIFEFNGTRKSPASNGYRPHHLVKNDYLTTGIHHYYGVNSVDPDGTATGTITFITPESYPHSLWVGKRISIQEGERIVGYATITKIFNPD